MNFKFCCWWRRFWNNSNDDEIFMIDFRVKAERRTPQKSLYLMWSLSPIMLLVPCAVPSATAIDVCVSECHTARRRPRGGRHTLSSTFLRSPHCARQHLLLYYYLAVNQLRSTQGAKGRFQCNVVVKNKFFV
jgi:hypothetical protein